MTVSDYFSDVRAFQWRVPDAFESDGMGYWYCHGCGFPWDMPVECCPFCPDWLLEAREPGCRALELRRAFRRALSHGL